MIQYFETKMLDFRKYFAFKLNLGLGLMYGGSK